MEQALSTGGGIAKEVIRKGRLSWRPLSFRAGAQCRRLALFGHAAMSDLSPLCEQKRTSMLACVTDPAPAFAFPNADLCGRN